MTQALHAVESPTVAVEVRARKNAVEFGVHVTTRASRARVGGEHGRRLRVRVRSVPEDGKANKELVALLAGELGTRKNEVEIVSGRTSRDKLVRVAAADPARTAARIVSLGGR